jgi:UPF0755 protein
MAVKSPKSGFSKIITILVLLVLLVAVFLGYRSYKNNFSPNVTDKEEYLYIPTGSTFEELMQNIEKNEILLDTSSFRRVAEKNDYPQSIKAGKYALEPGMNNRDLVRKLRAGLQEPVKFRFQNLRLKGDFAKHVSTLLEADSASIMKLMNNDSLAAQYGFNTENFYSMFIPNTYEIWWNTSSEKFFERMYTEYSKFWTEERLSKAKAINLSPNEVSILASIVKGEAMHNDEMPKIAGLYLNRLKRGILLQADPTVIFAAKDFTIRRVLNKHLAIPSPYNTYLNRGLPPGPITLPSIASIDAVLNPQKHEYIYMCAKDDFSGYHNFAKTMSEHLVNARKFQRALNERNIKR